METVFLTEQANQKVIDNPNIILNKRVDYLTNNTEHKLFIKDNNGRPTQEFIMYFPHEAIQAMMTKTVVKKYVYLILYTQEPGSNLDRFEEPYIWNDHDFDKTKGLTKQQLVFNKKYKKLKIYNLYSFDSDEDAKVFFRAFLSGVNCTKDTVFMFSKREITIFDNYMNYMRDRDGHQESEDEIEDEEENEDDDIDDDTEIVEEFAPYESD